jgi:small basic protein (TIGR04137 family)
MSLDRSFKSANALVRHRNVLNRAERLEKLKDEEKWTDEKSVFGLPKVAHRKAIVVKAAKVAEAGAEAAAGTVPGAPGAAAPAGAAPAAGAPAKGAAAPAAGAKASAAPAAKGKK